jgi:hypothetical protein
MTNQDLESNLGSSAAAIEMTFTARCSAASTRSINRRNLGHVDLQQSPYHLRDAFKINA